MASYKTFSARLKALPKLGDLHPERLVVVQDQDLALMAGLPIGSVSKARHRELRPAIDGATSVYRAGDVREFCDRHILAGFQRLGRAAFARNRDWTAPELEESLRKDWLKHLEVIANELNSTK